MEEVADLHQQTLLMDKWLNIMEDRFVLWGPGSFTYSGQVGPITATRPIIGAAFVPQTRFSSPATQRIVHWKNPMISQPTGRAITIDLPYDHLRKVETTLAQLSLSLSRNPLPGIHRR